MAALPAGLLLLCAGLVALEKAAPDSAERTVRLLEPGSTLLARCVRSMLGSNLLRTCLIAVGSLIDRRRKIVPKVYRALETVGAS